MDRAYYEEIAGLLHGLLIRLDDRLPGKDIRLIAEVIASNELRLALEQDGQSSLASLGAPPRAHRGMSVRSTVRRGTGSSVGVPTCGAHESRPIRSEPRDLPFPWPS